MNPQKKTKMKMNRLRLINWHFFNNDTIEFKNSNLFSGENGKGKSTILDAILMLLTTDTRKFNQAANGDSKRTVKTYVRGKTGDEGNEYFRKGAVISYAALEIYEESKNRYFVLGVKIDSPDLESDVKKKWFREEGTLEQLSFIVNNKPAMDSEFKNAGKKVSFIYSDKEARSQFKHRLGYLQDNFFELLPRSLAFRPMKNVKSFVSQFILPQRDVDIATLRENINSLSEMQAVVEQIKNQVNELEQIQNTYVEIQRINRDILVIDFLLKLAEQESNKNNIERIENDIVFKEQNCNRLQIEVDRLEKEYKALNDRYVDLLSSLKTGENAMLINSIKAEIKTKQNEKATQKNNIKKLREHIERVKAAISNLNNSINIDNKRILDLISDTISTEEKIHTIVDVKKSLDKARGNLDIERIQKTATQQQLKEEIEKLSAEIRSLEQNKITYNPNVTRLKSLIEGEFVARGINSPVYILSDLLEISDNKWQNAVEGYLNTQRFYIIVEPNYYDIAAQVYDRNKKSVHTAAIVNTLKLDTNTTPAEDSLASVLLTENRYARAFICYVLNKVKMCETVDELKQYETSITPECMLYQGKALRKINPEIYKMPYIGKYALQQQLEIKQGQQREKKADKAIIDQSLDKLNKAIALIDKCNFETINEVISSPVMLRRINDDIIKLEKELKDAENDPNYLQLKDKVAQLEIELKKSEERKDNAKVQVATIIAEIKNDKKFLFSEKQKGTEIDDALNSMSSGKENELSEAKRKFDEHKKTKSSDTIYENNQPRRTGLINNLDKQKKDLIFLQSKYKEGDLGTGVEMMKAYADEYNELTKHDLIKYEDKLKTIRQNCEVEFRESFLVKMRENIEKAKRLFKELNKTLKPIYYGDDSYQFECPPDNNKRKLYDMIMSNMNLGEYNLFSTQFDIEYHDEMEELFSKLSASDEKGEDVIREYTDYRSYMDYDISIITRDGRSQKFSKIYGEKSGGETQTPYYVAIAASFAQIYNSADTIRIIMLDEAFDRMDEDRIKSMMDFFKSQDFQIILAAPSTRLELIGEHTDVLIMTAEYHAVLPKQSRKKE